MVCQETTVITLFSTPQQHSVVQQRGCKKCFPLGHTIDRFPYHTKKILYTFVIIDVIVFCYLIVPLFLVSFVSQRADFIRAISSNKIISADPMQFGAKRGVEKR